MTQHSAPHSFHIPVMGIGFTIDTPAKVAHLGISSVISLVDDILLEKMRQFYSQQFNLPFEAISSRVDDFRAKRVTAYLDSMNAVARQKMEALKQAIAQKGEALQAYLDLLPSTSQLKVQLLDLLNTTLAPAELKAALDRLLPLGSIDVNIMTKLDKQAVRAGEVLPDMYRDAHSALRGFALAQNDGAMVFSAGMNPRLYSYCENFEGFYPDASGYIKKRIILKVSDYRSAIIQGKVFAKKGLWVSEYRIESGLNCGGHAFASDGMLMGPILEEFKLNRQDLMATTFEMYQAALKAKGRECPAQAPAMSITAQGGVGTHAEHNFLLNEYQLDSIGWGTPFLLAPDVTSVDERTLSQLEAATEKDLYLSNISPLGVPFNSLRGNTKDLEMQQWIAQGTPGSPCPKRFAALNTEFTEREICTASRQYQRIKLDELKTKDLAPTLYRKAEAKILEKSCICVGLGTPALLVNKLDVKVEGPGVSVCPGPNMAYFSRRTSLAEMAHHIYGRANVIQRTDRPNLFVKEMGLYIEYFRKQVEEKISDMTDKERKALTAFRQNLLQGMDYYKARVEAMAAAFGEQLTDFERALDAARNSLNAISLQPTVLLTAEHSKAM